MENVDLIDDFGGRGETAQETICQSRQLDVRIARNLHLALASLELRNRVSTWRQTLSTEARSGRTVCRNILQAKSLCTFPSLTPQPKQAEEKCTK
jgi:hypothetical protein